MNADEVRRDWANRSTEYSPGYYAYYGPNETSERVREVLDRYVGPDEPVLELGCSSGRHLKHLHDHGYGDLHGVDINDDAFDVMAETYPDLAEDGSFVHGSIEDAVRDFSDDRFGAVFSVETLQHIHADDEWVFGDLARITDDLLLTVECESPVDGDDDGATPDGASADRPDADDRSGVPEVNYVNGDIPLYYRRWGDIFTGLGMDAVETRPLERDTLRAFRHAGG